MQTRTMRRLCALSTTWWLAWGLCGAAAATESESARWHQRLRDGRLTASTGSYFATGDYGRSDDTEFWYVPFELRYDVFPFSARVTVPYLRMDGPMNVVGPLGGGPVGEEDGAEVRSRQGLGDVMASLSYTYARSASWLPAIRFTGKVKFGTADRDEGLGTGENDFILETDLSKRFGRFTPFGALGYRFVGDPPGLDLRDAWLARTGLNYRVRDHLESGLIYSWRQASSRTSGDSHVLMPYASWRLGKRFSVMPYSLVGLSTNSPDFGAGLQLSVVLSGSGVGILQGE